tara:strand:+ start:862 stop:1086 length:225 start_codon:yes stop_codon:yes gene_type:complete
MAPPATAMAAVPARRRYMIVVRISENDTLCVYDKKRVALIEEWIAFRVQGEAIQQRRDGINSNKIKLGRRYIYI